MKVEIMEISRVNNIVEAIYYSEVHPNRIPKNRKYVGEDIWGRVYIIEDIVYVFGK